MNGEIRHLPARLTLSIDNRARDGIAEFDEAWPWVNFLEENTLAWRSFPASAVVQILWTPEEEASNG
jgi:hypothetical protein